MKLSSTINLRPDFLYVAPLLNVVSLLLVYFLFNTNLVLPSGVRVELPVSASSLKEMEDAHVLTLTAGTEPEIYFNRERVTMPELLQKLGVLRNDKAASRNVVIDADKLVAHGRVIEVMGALWDAGFNPAVRTVSD